MAKERSEKLPVERSASQVRKVLKGKGLGVLRVETAGKNRSVVVHTATGQHRRKLASLLADATGGTAAFEAATPVRELRNLGAVSSQWLRTVGIKTKGDLQKRGPLVAFRLVKQKHPRASLNLLWALAGALQDRDWRALPASERKRLLFELERD